jgi:hypothetical protein
MNGGKAHVAGVADWVDELCFGPEGAEMTLSDFRLDYPEPEVLAKMPLKRAGQLVSTPP